MKARLFATRQYSVRCVLAFVALCGCICGGVRYLIDCELEEGFAELREREALARDLRGISFFTGQRVPMWCSPFMSAIDRQRVVHVGLSTWYPRWA